ncbi:precorrin-6A reductase [Anaerovorax odorimutans]|uniref:precorrin-2 dehydrogenase n=1 Tax=Anaerovorax odorimutans TaxID=109327 RepID=A0ABT1RMH8_9FIRM|nr:precorrin-6A reductase [Anaerovorax odorimutans]MCQ4636375.1 precorrin-6A reductase [Anaerovorax odorimutans]
MSNILIFAGTTEGRKLAEAAADDQSGQNRFLVCVATEHGKHLLPKDSDSLTVLARRLDRREMEELIRKENIDRVIDATHPYAAEATENIRMAAEHTGVPCMRLLRRQAEPEERHIITASAKEAAEYLKDTSGNVLLTTGSKELAEFTVIADFEKRLYPRILPVPEMVKRAFDLGFDAAHLICMQGPFSYEDNLAMLRHINADYLVTKESGEAGGFSHKLAAAEAAGAKVIIIGRPKQEEGISLEEALKLCGLSQVPAKKAAWFPMFQDLTGKRILVVGGGRIAARRIRILSQYNCLLTVVAPEVLPPVKELERQGLLRLEERPYEEADLEDADIVLAATGDRELNRSIGILCRQKEITVNVADRKEECDFYFPGVIRHGDLTIGFTAGGKDHALAKKARILIERGLENGLDR